MSTQTSLLAFKKLVHAHCGLVLEGIAEDRLHKALLKNAEQLGCQDLQDYERLVRRDKQSFEQLISQLTVNETYFFREPEQIQLLSEVLVPQVLAQKHIGLRWKDRVQATQPLLQNSLLPTMLFPFLCCIKRFRQYLFVIVSILVLATDH